MRSTILPSSKYLQRKQRVLLIVFWISAYRWQSHCLCQYKGYFFQPTKVNTSNNIMIDWSDYCPQPTGNVFKLKSLLFWGLTPFEFLSSSACHLSPLSLMARELKTLRLLQISPCQIGPGDLPPETSPWVLSMYKADLRLAGVMKLRCYSLISPHKCGQENYLLRLPFWVLSTYKTNLYKTGRGHETPRLSPHILRLMFWSHQNISPIWDWWEQ